MHQGMTDEEQLLEAQQEELNIEPTRKRKEGAQNKRIEEVENLQLLCRKRREEIVNNNKNSFRKQ